MSDAATPDGAQSIAAGWRRRLGPSLRRLVLIDGPSGAGKTRLVAETIPRVEGASAVRRTTSRPRRGTDTTDEYEFVSVEEFEEAERNGEFLESKEFLFDMRYGLRWSEVERTLAGAQVALGVMNLGNVDHVARTAPEVVRVLVTASFDDLRRRIEARGTHTREAIDERLDNARRLASSSHLYDHVLVNADGDFDRTRDALEAILRETAGR
jgi:guanylate kinase